MNMSDHIILCRDIRRFIIERGTATTDEIRAAFPNYEGCLSRMEYNRSIRRCRNEDGQSAWRPVPILPIREVDVEADLSFERDD